MTQVDPETIRSAVEAATPVTVRTTGWSWTAYGVWALVALMSPLVIALTRMWPAMKKLRNEADGSLRADLLAELANVRADLSRERAECDRRMSALQNKMDAVTRQFVQFQLTVVRYMPEEYAPHAQRAANNLLAVIARDVEEFAPAAEEPETEAAAEDNG